MSSMYDEIRTVVDSTRTPIKKYQEELERDTRIDIYNIKERSLQTSAIRAKWLGFYSKEKEALNVVLDLQAKYKRKQMEQVKDADSFAKLRAANGVGAIDETEKKVNDTKKEIELTLDFILKALDVCSGLDFQISNSIKLLQMNN